MTVEAQSQPAAKTTINSLEYLRSAAKSTEVQELAANRLLATRTAAPYSFTWNGVALGNHTVIAVATDVNGKIGFSLPISFRVQ